MTQDSEAPRTLQDKPNGPAVAALLAAGVGSFTIGFMAFLGEISWSVHDFLPWVKAVGPLSGKVFITLAVWVVTWAVLHVLLRGRNVGLNGSAIAVGGLVALGIVLMMPPVWHLFTQ